jgi:spore coat protein JB
MNNANVNSDLAEQVRRLCFVKAELELYLDTHPRCKTALDYYYQTVDALKNLREEYANTVGPLVATESADIERWTWTDSPWPWQNGEETATPKCKGERR